MRSGLGPAPLPGSRRDSHQPGRRQHARRFDEVVDVRVVRRVVTARASRDPAAERRPRKTLRKMPQRITARPQRTFEIGSVDAGLNARGARHVVDFEHAIEPDRGRSSRPRRMTPARSRPTPPTCARPTESRCSRSCRTTRAWLRVPLRCADAQPRRAAMRNRRASPAAVRANDHRGYARRVRACRRLPRPAARLGIAMRGARSVDVCKRRDRRQPPPVCRSAWTSSQRTCGDLRHSVRRVRIPTSRNCVGLASHSPVIRYAPIIPAPLRDAAPASTGCSSGRPGQRPTPCRSPAPARHSPDRTHRSHNPLRTNRSACRPSCRANTPT